MADYRDLLRRAVEALPENNGNARRQVYDKARKALRNQLDAIKPELPSREKTFHRLQLEECIREVEQEATERLLGGFSQFDSEALHLDHEVESDAQNEQDELEPVAETVGAAASGGRTEAGSASSRVSEQGEEPVQEPESTPAAKTKPAPASKDKGEAKSPAPAAEKPAKDAGKAPTEHGGKAPASIDDVIRQAQTVAADAAKTAPAAKAEGNESRAMSAVREVDVENSDDVGTDPQQKIDHAIAMLDREASGEASDYDGDSMVADPATADIGFAKGELDEERGSNALMIFLVIFAVLVIGVGGAGFWAWREGYVDLGTLFGQTNVATAENTTTSAPAAATNESAAAATPTPDEPSSPGNTSTSADTNSPSTEVAPTTSDEIDSAENSGPNTETAATPSIAEPDSSVDSNKIEERLPTETTQPQSTTDTAASADSQPADVVAEGGQSLLLEASDQGTTGAVPFSGTVEWNRGSDELGQPTLIATAKIPARNLGLKVLIRKNADPTLPASHLMEVDFDVTDSFVGGGVARIAGVLMKDEELVQGEPLVGASARVVGNSFLFALSSSDQDLKANAALLKSRKWMDFAMIYSTGKQAIITLEKDDKAQALFDEVLSVWDSEPAPATTAGEATSQ